MRRRSRPAGRRRMRRLLLLLALLLACVAAEPGPAQAANLPVPPIPGVGDCLDPPDPVNPTSGFIGLMDPGPRVAKDAGDFYPDGPGGKVNPNIQDPAFVPNSGLSLYGEYGYPQKWNTYDFGCGGEARDPGSAFDTKMGNFFLGSAATLTAAENGLHRQVSPPDWLSALDPLLAKGVSAATDGIMRPWLALSMVALAAIVVFMAFRKNVSWATASVLWLLFVLGVAGVVIGAPVQAGHSMDGIVRLSSDVTNMGIAQAGGATGLSDPVEARGELLVDVNLYHNWLKGELGDDDSPIAQKYGPDLFYAQHLSYKEARMIKAHPEASNEITDLHKAVFEYTAKKIKDTSDYYYNRLKGQAGSRPSAGVMAAFTTLCTVPFLMIADLMELASLLIARLGVEIYPVFVPPGLHLGLSDMIKEIFKAILAAVFNAAMFLALAGLNVLWIQAILGDGGDGPTGTSAASGIPKFIAILLCLLVMIVLWYVGRPFRRLTAMVPSSAFASGVGGPAKAARNAAATAAAGAALYAMQSGGGAAGGGGSSGTGAAGLGGGRFGRRSDDPGLPPPEAWSRPDVDVGAQQGTRPPAGSAPAPRAGAGAQEHPGRSGWEDMVGGDVWDAEWWEERPAPTRPSGEMVGLSAPDRGGSLTSDAPSDAVRPGPRRLALPAGRGADAPSDDEPEAPAPAAPRPSGVLIWDSERAAYVRDEEG
jgi:hypothetical protein